MIKNILFDMDMTILDFNQAEQNALRGALTATGIESHEEILHRYHEINVSQWKLLEQGLLERDRLRVRRFELLFEELGIEMAPEPVAADYESRLSEGYDYLDGAKELLEQLQGKYNMYIVSNGAASIQHSRIEGAKLARYFDGIYISQEVGYHKPDKRFFDVCFADIETKTKEPLDLKRTVIIGDSLTSDMQGGIRAGVRTVWYNPMGKPHGEIVPEHEVQSLEEIPRLLTSM